MIGPLGVRDSSDVVGALPQLRIPGIPAYDALIKDEADWFTTPGAGIQKRMCAKCPAFKDDPRILAWEVMNEDLPRRDARLLVRWTNAISTHPEVDPIT